MILLYVLQVKEPFSIGQDLKNQLTSIESVTQPLSAIKTPFNMKYLLLLSNVSSVWKLIKKPCKLRTTWFNEGHLILHVLTVSPSHVIYTL